MLSDALVSWLVTFFSFADEKRIVAKRRQLTERDQVAAARGATRRHCLGMGLEKARMASISTTKEGYQERFPRGMTWRGDGRRSRRRRRGGRKKKAHDIEKRRETTKKNYRRCNLFASVTLGPEREGAKKKIRKKRLQWERQGKKPFGRRQAKTSRRYACAASLIFSFSNTAACCMRQLRRLRR